MDQTIENLLAVYIAVFVFSCFGLASYAMDRSSDEIFWIPKACRNEMLLRPFFPLVAIWPALLWPLIVIACSIVGLFETSRKAVKSLCRIGESTTLCGVSLRKEHNDLGTKAADPDSNDVEAQSLDGAKE